MPRICGVSAFSTECSRLYRPSAWSVPSTSFVTLAELPVCVILSFRAIAHSPRAEELGHRHAARLSDVARAPQVTESVHGRLRDVVRVGRAQRLREHVLHA